eukprot:1986136-Amphidinium_carterae.2
MFFVHAAHSLPSSEFHFESVSGMCSENNTGSLRARTSCNILVSLICHNCEPDTLIERRSCMEITNCEGKKRRAFREAMQVETLHATVSPLPLHKADFGFAKT